MARIHRPDRGSRAFSPRKRAKSHIPRIRACPSFEDTAKLQEFAGYKAGMTHVIMIDDVKNSRTFGSEISVPVTIVETPDISVIAIRIYILEENMYQRADFDIWSDNLDLQFRKKLKLKDNIKNRKNIDNIEELLEEKNVSDIRVIVHTNPKDISGIPKKTPDVMEMRISGENIKEKFDFAKSILGKLIKFSDVFKNGSLVDTISITTGKGTQGPVKRWGISLMKGKHSRQGSLRQIGNLGPRGVCRVFWLTPQMGQTGFHQRTEYNKRILKIGVDGKEVTPVGGIINYGSVNGNYVLIHGSVPGPSKRLIRIRNPIRPKKIIQDEPRIIHISTKSQQG